MHIYYISVLVLHASLKNVIISKTAAILKSLSSYCSVAAFPKLYVDKIWYKPYKYIGVSYR